MSNFKDALLSVGPASREHYRLSAERQSHLTKPPGALGRLEEIANRYSAMTEAFLPLVPGSPVVCIFAADHGVLEEGLSPWPMEVTTQMVGNFLSGGAAINAIARQVGASVSVVDIGVAGDLSGLSGVIDKKVRRGTGNLAKAPAMTLAEAGEAIQAGFDVGTDLIEAGADLLITGDMGIGNTTPSSALISWFAESEIAATTGRGTGIGDEMMEIKIRAIRAAHSRVLSQGINDPVEVLSSIGGLEIAGIIGLIVAGSSRKVPVVLDGVIAAAAAIVAAAMNKNVVDYLFAGHLSVEPGAQIALRHLGLEPILTLDLRLGEGTGGCLSVPVIQSAVRTLVEMATFDSAGISNG